MKNHSDVFEKCHEFHEAEEARKGGWYPFFRPIEANHGSRVVIEGREMIMAGSNNYLGLAFDERVREAAIHAVEQYGSSCSGSRFMNGSLALHEELEQKLATFVGKESALVFTTGYQSNLGAISALLGADDHVVTDKLDHASIMDGVFLARGMQKNITMHRFRHNDLADLRKVLERIPESAGILIIVDGVFSMEGDIALLPEIRKIADDYGARVYLDEAHAIGVLGKSGRGTVEHFEGVAQPDLTMCTFSKALASIGGFIAGEERVIDYIRHHARPLIFSASMPPATIGATLKSIEIIQQEPERVQRLQHIARFMLDGFKALGFNTGTAETPIVPLHIGDNQKTFLFWKALFERGVYVNPVIAPAVPPNGAMIRTSYMAVHTDEELETILRISGEEGKKLGIIQS
ncbi:MAG: pyridoxal phosphate-dependent aminotransferase family protein [Spirochaetales bacterium]|nr:pyridoxal phosphate-dependent aminotransferase family protein [Spirochaetales bacterium]